MIGQHLTIEQCCKSETAIRKGIDNTPSPDIVSVMNQTAIHIYDPLKEQFGNIAFSSFYRSVKLNKAIGGSPTSSHCKGEAIDFDMDGIKGGITNSMLFYYVLNNLEFDQLIWEFGTDENPAWVHVGYRKGNNRKQVLKAVKENGKTVYKPFKAL